MGRPDISAPAQAFSPHIFADRQLRGDHRVYWAFTLTDGALRMLVVSLLPPARINSSFGNRLPVSGFTNLRIVTTFMAAVLGARLGLRLTLWAGLVLQIRWRWFDAWCRCQPAGPRLFRWVRGWRLGRISRLAKIN